MYTKEQNAAINRQLQKEIIKTKVIHPLDNLEDVICKIESAKFSCPAQFEISDEVKHNGKPSFKVVCPNTLDPIPHRRVTYGCTRVRFDFDKEDWSEYNRISFWVYPEKNTYDSVHIYMEYINGGENPFPNDNYLSGGHVANVTAGRWNNVIWEIPELPRDDVKMFQISFIISGKQANMEKDSIAYFSDFEVQKVNADKYMGWDTDGKISFCHSGYAPDDIKHAVTSIKGGDTFTVIEDESGKIAYAGKVEKIESDIGVFNRLDFSSFNKKGRYYLCYENLCTGSFEISDEHWMPAIDKIRNFFNKERCGCTVEGIHLPCHINGFTEHSDGRKLSIAGGWHDAHDLSQGLCNTAEAVHSFFDAAHSLKDKNPELSKELYNEARYGLEWMLKTRFEDGFRCVWSGCNVWTGGCTDSDDSFSIPADRKPFECLCAAGTEAKAYSVYKDTEPMFASWCLKCAQEDYKIAIDDFAPFSSQKDVSDKWLTAPAQIFAQASFAASMLYEATEDEKYLDEAISYADYVMECQQQELPDWETPIHGFFYEEKEKITPLSYDHRAHEQVLIMCIAELLKNAPNNDKSAKWKNCLENYREYINKLMEFSEVYHQIPAGIYFADAPASVTGSGDHKKARLDMKKYLKQIESGIKLNDGVYLRRMPVALKFRGSFGIQMSKAKAVSTLGKALNDASLLEIAKQQVAWVLGNNPFSRSYMYGEGYDFPNMNAPFNSFDVAGELPVGMHSFEDTDIPYMPMTIQATYYEVWVHPASRMLWTIADF